MDKINFENLPSENTPINEDNLNLMQSNIEKSVVAVGKTQPSTSENVWLKKGKNLFNKNTIFRGYIETSSQKIVTAQDEFYSCYAKVNPNTIYTVSKQAGKSFRIATTNIVPTNGATYTSTTANHTGTSITITTGANDNYICIFFYATSNGDTGGYENMANTIQVEQNSTATTYEAYINKEILVKNSNGVFEEFYNEGKNVTERIDNDNGTALKFNNGIMIQYGAKDLTTGSNSYNSGFSHYGVSTSINMPASFTNANYTVIANANTPIDYIGIVSANRGTASAFDIRFVSSQANYQRLIYWIAIGNW